jgi:hypothetical protein
MRTAQLAELKELVAGRIADYKEANATVLKCVKQSFSQHSSNINSANFAYNDPQLQWANRPMGFQTPLMMGFQQHPALMQPSFQQAPPQQQAQRQPQEPMRAYNAEVEVDGEKVFLSARDRKVLDL